MNTPKTPVPLYGPIHSRLFAFSVNRRYKFQNYIFKKGVHMTSYMTKIKETSAFLTVLAACFFLINGCVSMGRDFPVDSVPKIQQGKTTQQDILRMFGPPWRTGIEDGKTVWTYGRYNYYLLGGSNTYDLVIHFNKENVVESYTYNTSSP